MVTAVLLVAAVVVSSARLGALRTSAPTRPSGSTGPRDHSSWADRSAVQTSRRSTDRALRPADASLPGDRRADLTGERPGAARRLRSACGPRAVDELVACAVTCTRTPSCRPRSAPRRAAAGCSGGCTRSCRRRRPDLRHRHRRDRVGRRCGPTSTRCRSSDEKDVPYRSTVPGVCHACGHDVHTAVVLGAGLVLADAATARAAARAGPADLPAGRGVTPGGALDVIAAGGAGRRRADLRAALRPARRRRARSACGSGRSPARPTRCTVRLTGPGGHTARPHLTADLVFALGKVVTELPAVLSRRVDPRAGAVAWSGGRIAAGTAANAIPRERRGRGHRALPRRRRLGAAPRSSSSELVAGRRRAVRRRARGRPTRAACRRW